jgi:hypothetical protein
VKQQYTPYWQWEDYINGMWRKLPTSEEHEMLKLAIEFTGNYILYGNAMKEVSIAWPNTMLNTLTNVSVNRRAFLGHCACQFKINCPEYITRIAWYKLTDLQRWLADNVAQKTINKWVAEYERKDREVYSGLAEKMLF